MKEKINQKGFILTPILIIAIMAIVASSVGLGFVLHKQEKLVSNNTDTASISEAMEQIKQNEKVINTENEEMKEELQNEQKPTLEVKPKKEKANSQGIDKSKIIPQERQKITEEAEPELEIKTIEEETAEPESIPEVEEPSPDPCADIVCLDCQYCDTGVCVNYCQETDNNCGCVSCNNCNDLDGCSENSYLDYSCSNTSCIFDSDDCSDCSCSCGGYNIEEGIENGNCEDGKDNDCDGFIDLEDSKCGLFNIETSIVDYRNAPTIQVTIQGKEGGIDLILSGPNRNTVDENYISKDDMLDGAETVWLYLQEYLNSTATPGIYTLIITHRDNEIFRRKFDIKGAKPIILGHDNLTYKYYDYFGYDFATLTITVENKGDLPVYFRTLDIILDGKKGVGGGLFSEDKILAGQNKIIKMRNIYYGNFSAGAHKMILKINGQINGKSTVLTTYTTTIIVP